MVLDDKVIGLLIALLSTLIAFLAYRVSLLSRKENKSNINVEWKPPFNLPVYYTDRDTIDLYYLIEAIFANTGGKAVTAVELLGGQKGFLYTQQLNLGKSIKEFLYTPAPDLFILPNPILTYVDKEKIFQIHNSKKYKTINNNIPLEIPLDIVIAPGESVRLSLCFYVKDYKKPAEKGDNHIFTIVVKFNNNQRSCYNVLVGGFLSLVGKYKMHNNMLHVTSQQAEF